MGAVGTRHLFIIVFIATIRRVIVHVFIRALVRILTCDVRLNIRSPHATECRQGFGLIIQSGILHKTLRRPMQGVNVGRRCRQGHL